MSRIISPGRQNELPRAPGHLQDTLELYARASGRTAKWHFIPYGGWVARFELRCDDKRMQLYKDGRADAPPTEDVWFHIQNPHEQEIREIRGSDVDKQYPLIGVMCYGYKRQGTWLPLDIIKMGAEGVKEFLEKGNTWSGRGEFGSIEEAVKKALEFDRKKAAAVKETAKSENRIEQREKRRQRLGIPLIQAGIDFVKQKVKGA